MAPDRGLDLVRQCKAGPESGRHEVPPPLLPDDPHLWLEDVEPADFLALADKEPEETDTVTLEPAELHAALAQVIGEEVRAALGRLRGRVD